jgi:HSP20 family protein
MALLKYERPRTFDTFDRFFDRWPTLWWTREFEDILRVDEFQDNGTWVIRAELAGIDPDKDVEITVSNGVVHIHAERREEEKTEKKDFYRRELRYGSFSRALTLPEGCSEGDVTASYKDGILEVRVPTPKTSTTEEAKKVTVDKS